MRKKYSEFSELAENYDAARPAYPDRIISLIKRASDKKRPLILDVGCGTGIGTRQLVKFARVVGCDIDTEMLTIAQKRSSNKITYVRAATDKLPFPDETFDIVTAFTAFHWFNNAKSIREIKRVLKPRGILCIIQPEHVSPFRRQIRAIIEEVLRKKLTRTYSWRPFDETIKAAKFRLEKEVTVQRIASYRLNKYMKLAQSYSAWNQISAEKRPEILERLKKHFASKLKGGFIRDVHNVKLLIVSK